MSKIADPGVFLLVAWVACIHATYLLTRRYGSRARADYFVCSLLILGAGAAILSQGRGSLLLWALPLACGVFLGTRSKHPGMFAAFVGGAFAVNFGFITWARALAPLSEWEVMQSKGQFETAQRLVASLRGPVARGFVDEEAAGWKSEFYYDQPVTRWHTPITGVPGKRIFYYRVWTPGGPPNYAAAHLRLVRAGDPEPVWRESDLSRTGALTKR